MGLEVVSLDDFRRAVGWASDHGRRMAVREVRCSIAADGSRVPVPGRWHPLSYRGGRLCWTDPEASPFPHEQERTVVPSRAMRFRLDTLEGKADVRDWKGIHLQIRIEVPDTL